MGPVQVRYADGERERHGNSLVFSGHLSAFDLIVVFEAKP
jgi:hypothetical protein